MKRAHVIPDRWLQGAIRGILARGEAADELAALRLAVSRWIEQGRLAERYAAERR